MKQLLNRLIHHETISKEEARQTLIGISNGEYNPAQVAAFMTVFMMRNITVEELEGFRDALLELCIRLPFEQYNTIDLCGTGGDGKDTFNISTLAAFITAGAGILVAKHGNYGVSSTCGSSNVMEHLGLSFSNNLNLLKRQLEEAGICFLHAQLFHPAMKQVAPIRKELGVKTFFNMLGPMVNPAFPKNQLVGVYNLEIARLYGYLYQNTNKKYAILHALDGYDEISLTGGTKIIRNQSEQILYPNDWGLAQLKEEDISGGNSVEQAAQIFINVLEGKGTKAQNQVVCTNAGMAIATVENLSHTDGYLKAKESLASGKALQAFRKLIAIT